MMTIRHDLGYFAMAPERIVANASAAALKLWCVLWIYTGNGTHNAWPSHDRLASDMRCSPSTVKRTLAELMHLGALSVEHREGTSNLYTLHWNFVHTQVTGDPLTQVTHDLPPRSPMTYKERQSEIHKHPAAKQVTRDHLRTPGDNPLTREQIRQLTGRTDD